MHEQCSQFHGCLTFSNFECEFQLAASIITYYFCMFVERIRLNETLSHIVQNWKCQNQTH